MPIQIPVGTRSPLFFESVHLLSIPGAEKYTAAIFTLASWLRTWSPGRPDWLENWGNEDCKFPQGKSLEAVSKRVIRRQKHPPLLSGPDPSSTESHPGVELGDAKIFQSSLGWYLAELKAAEIYVYNHQLIEMHSFGVVFEGPWVREHIDKMFGANQDCKPEGRNWIEDDWLSLALFGLPPFQKQISCLNSSRDSSIPTGWSLNSLGWHSRPFAILSQLSLCLFSHHIPRLIPSQRIPHSSLDTPCLFLSLCLCTC